MDVIDAEIRRCGEQIGFDTLVVRTDNVDYWAMELRSP